MSNNPYQKWRQDRCEWCAAGLPKTTNARAGREGEERGHFDPLIPYESDSRYKSCTAPTEAEYIAELEAVLRVRNIPTRQHSDEAWRKRVAELEQWAEKAEHSEGEYKSRIACLSMFVRRLYRKLSKHEPNAEVIQQANTYLKAIGQAGTPLRAEEADAAMKEAADAKK